MAEIEINGTRLYYEDTGPGSTGETIALSHGLLWSTALFAPQIAALRERYRCIAWDHRGQGKSASDPLRSCIGMELVWKDAERLLEAIAGGPVHFVGLSMGGFVGLRMASRRPDLVRTLSLIETSAEPEPPENVPRYRMLANVSRAVGVRPLRRKVLPIMLGRSILTAPSRRAEVDRFGDIMTSRRDVWRAVNGVIDRAPVTDELARVRCPTLIVVGEEDTATPIPKAERLAAGISGSRLVRIPRAGHSSTVEEPEAVTQALAAFLTSPVYV